MTQILSREGAAPQVSGFFFFIRVAGGAALWIRYLGGHPLNGKISWGVSVLGGDTADGEAPSEETGQELDIHLGGNGKGGGGVHDDGGLHQIGRASCSDWGDDDPRTYRMVYPAKAGPRPCPVVGCSGRV